MKEAYEHISFMKYWVRSTDHRTLYYLLTPWSRVLHHGNSAYMGVPPIAAIFELLVGSCSGIGTEHL